MGEGGEVILQLFEDSMLMTIRQPEQERLAEVRLTEIQAQVIVDAIAQMGTNDEEDELS